MARNKVISLTDEEAKHLMLVELCTECGDMDCQECVAETFWTKIPRTMMERERTKK